MRCDHRSKSLHYFNSYAVLDRIDVTSLDTSQPDSCQPSPDSIAKSLLPTCSDDNILVQNIKILFSRILCQTLPFFERAFSDIIVHHIKHRRYSSYHFLMVWASSKIKPFT